MGVLRAWKGGAVRGCLSLEHVLITVDNREQLWETMTGVGDCLLKTVRGWDVH